MTHKLIHTPNYLLVVDDSEIKEGDYCLMFDDFGNLFLGNLPSQYLGEKNGHHLNKGLKKIIAHLPLNNSPILEGVDLLPPFSRHQEDGIEKIAEQEYPTSNLDLTISVATNVIGQSFFIEGYNKAKEKYKYTEEDIRMAVRDGSAMGEVNDEEYEEYVKWIIQSLSQPKMPVAFECEIEYFYMSSKEFYKDADWVKCDKAQYESIREEIPTCPLKKVHKEISTPEGHTQLVGKYIY